MGHLECLQYVATELTNGASTFRSDVGGCRRQATCLPRGGSHEKWDDNYHCYSVFSEARAIPIQRGQHFPVLIGGDKSSQAW